MTTADAVPALRVRSRLYAAEASVLEKLVRDDGGYDLVRGCTTQEDRIQPS